jgi:hypothetical protein
MNEAGAATQRYSGMFDGLLTIPKVRLRVGLTPAHHPEGAAGLTGWGYGLGLRLLATL